MSDEGTCRGSTRYALQRGCLHLGVAGLVEDAAHSAQHGGPLDEGVLHAVVDDEVYVALAVALLGVVKLVVGHTVLVFYDGQRLDALAQQLERAGVNRDLARLGFEDETLHTHEVADVEQFLKHLIIEVFVLTWADIVAGDVNLYSSLAILKLHKAGLTHYTAAHDTPCHNHIGFLVVLIVGYDVLRIGTDGELSCRVWVDAHVAQLLKTLSANNFLFA